MQTTSPYHGRTIPEVVTGKPVSVGGTVGRREATGRGVVHTAGRALDKLNIKRSEATAIIQGFGNVGSWAARIFSEQGVKVIGVSDHAACYYDPRGLDVAAMVRHANTQGLLAGYSEESLFDPAELLLQKCDVLVPAAVERVITGENAKKLRCRVLAEGANGPTTPDADAILADRKDEIFVVPDILCNSGGVIVSYFEWVQDLQQFFWDESEVNERLTRILDKAMNEVLSRATREKVSNRTAAMSIGVGKVHAGKRTRGLFP